MNTQKFMQNTGFTAVIVYLLVLLGLVIGWIMNIVEIVHALADPITGMFIARLVGTVVFPLGGVLGYF